MAARECVVCVRGEGEGQGLCCCHSQALFHHHVIVFTLLRVPARDLGSYLWVPQLRAGQHWSPAFTKRPSKVSKAAGKSSRSSSKAEGWAGVCHLGWWGCCHRQALPQSLHWAPGHSSPELHDCCSEGTQLISQTKYFQQEHWLEVWVPSPAVAFLTAGRAFLFYCTDGGCSIPSFKYVLRWHG